eukprot:COSAG02_NODE_323_length_24725_cov_57.558272_12_plen_64_part_00
MAVLSALSGSLSLSRLLSVVLIVAARADRPVALVDAQIDARVARVDDAAGGGRVRLSERRQHI